MSSNGCGRQRAKGLKIFIIQLKRDDTNREWLAKRNRICDTKAADSYEKIDETFTSVIPRPFKIRPRISAWVGRSVNPSVTRFFFWMRKSNQNDWTIKGKSANMVHFCKPPIEYLNLEDVALPKIEGVLLQPKRNMLQCPYLAWMGPIGLLLI